VRGRGRGRGRGATSARAKRCPRRRCARPTSSMGWISVWRTFQLCRAFVGMAAREKVVVGGLGARRTPGARCAATTPGCRRIWGRLHAIFPVPRERAARIVTILSGGQARMVAIGLAHRWGRPVLLLLDGGRSASRTRSRSRSSTPQAHPAPEHGDPHGEAQDARSALRIADRGVVLEDGRVGRAGTSRKLASVDYTPNAYLSWRDHASRPRPPAARPAAAVRIRFLPHSESGDEVIVVALPRQGSRRG